MRRSIPMRRALLLCAVALLASPGRAKADLLTFTQTFVADFEFTLLAGGPLNGGPMDLTLPFQAVGDLTFTLAPSLNDPSQPTTVPFTNLTGILNGTAPTGFLPYTISPNVQFLGGALTDIVRDLDGNVTSANIVNLTSLWELIGPNGIRLYGDAGLDFSGAITSLPLGFGTIIAGAADFNVYLDTGGGPGVDPLAAIGRNRTLRAVPAPSGLALLGMGAIGALILARARPV